MPAPILRSLELPGLRKMRAGKVRDIFDLGDQLLLVATDRISAFDCILPDPIPHKGAVLNQLSAFWFGHFTGLANHLITADFTSFPDALQPFRAELAGRSMIVKKTTPLPIECVVRGYLAGSGWHDYQRTSSISGQPLPRGLTQAAQLPDPLFTPSTKNDSGHDQSITWDECRALVGDDLATRVRELSLQLYTGGRDHAALSGIIVADTKFEFGLLDGELILIDECLTPDSSRFWPNDQYVPGANPPSFDKQFVRDYLETLAWNKTPPAPALPPMVIESTSRKYREAFERLTGWELDESPR